MKIAELNTPQRVWINSPSTLEPYYKYHGKVGIAVRQNNDVYVYFTTSKIHSMKVSPMYLSLKYGD